MKGHLLITFFLLLKVSAKEEISPCLAMLSSVQILEPPQFVPVEGRCPLLVRARSAKTVAMCLNGTKNI